MKVSGRRVYTVIAGGLLFLLYFVIFSFSAQDGETSGGISLKISGMGVNFWNELMKKGWDREMLRELAVHLEHPIRKMAHFGEYALMAFLQYSILYCNVAKRNAVLIAAFIWLSVSAAADEIHQLFVPGRCGSVSDVVLDICGGIFGVLMCILVIKIIKNIRKNRAKRT